MSSTKRRVLPAILLANDLRDGDVVFYREDGWARDPAQAAVACTDAEALAFEAHASRAVAGNQIVDPYLAEVVMGAGGAIELRHFRERFRALGPSVRPDLGKQAISAPILVAAE